MKFLTIMASVIGLIGVGDSITYGGLGGQSGQPLSYFWNASGITSIGGTAITNNDVLRWSYRVRATINGKSVIFCNAAIGGTKLTDMVSEFSTHVQPLIQKSQGNPPLSVYANNRKTRKYILSLMAGTNSDTTDPNTHIANMLSYVTTARAAGFDKVIVNPLLSRTDGAFLGAPGSTTWDTTLMIPYNASIVANPSVVGADVITRWDQEPLLCAAGAANNGTYFDQYQGAGNGAVHPLIPGAALMYPYFVTALNTVLATL